MSEIHFGVRKSVGMKLADDVNGEDNKNRVDYVAKPDVSKVNDKCGHRRGRSLTFAEQWERLWKKLP